MDEELQQQQEGGASALEQDGKDDDFDAGFTGAATTGEDPPPPAVEPTPSTDTPPEYVQITKEQFDTLMSAAAKVNEIEATTASIRDTAMGKIGGLERALNDLRASGGVSDEDLAQLREEYPDLAELKVFQKLRGGAAAPDPEAMAQVVQQHALPLVQQTALEAQELMLDMLHGDWRDVIGLPDDTGKTPETEFRKWMATQSQDEQAALNSPRALDLHRALNKFKAARATPSNAPDPNADARRRRLAAAAPVRGEGGGGRAALSEDDEFDQGFKEG